MNSENHKNNLGRSLGFLFLIFAVALLPRVLDLGAILSPDEPRWEENVIGFREAVESGDTKGLYQQPHPGIPTMWLTALVIDSDSWAVKRLPYAAANSLLVAIAAWIAARLWGWKVGTAAGLLLALNPHFIAHSRVLSMDAMLSIFLVITLLAWLAWWQERTQMGLVVSGAAAALAILSKLAGLVILPFLAAHAIWIFSRNLVSTREWFRTGGIWAASFIVALVFIFPTLLTNSAHVVNEFITFFQGDLFTNAVHALGPWWYPQALLLWTTPLHLLGLTFAIVILLPTKPRRQLREDVSFLLLFALVFFLFVQFSVKKGDRYLLPDFLIFDVLTALALVSVWRLYSHKVIRVSLVVLVALTLGWQVWNVFELHPHYLAYRNPFFRSVAQGRTMGWGEGLDLAAEHLNQKPNAKNMLVISYYENSFAQHFQGEVTSAERLAEETPEGIGGEYVVLYRTMQGRAPERWETKVLAQFAEKTPEHVISLNGEEYVWIYAVK